MRAGLGGLWVTVLGCAVLLGADAPSAPGDPWVLKIAGVILVIAGIGLMGSSGAELERERDRWMDLAAETEVASDERARTTATAAEQEGRSRGEVLDAAEGSDSGRDHEGRDPAGGGGVPAGAQEASR